MLALLFKNLGKSIENLNHYYNSKSIDMNRMCHSVLKISAAVAQALSSRKPVVALQSTIISHGMPYPQNKECALSIENKIRQQGAVPATVAIFDGKVHVGLDEKQIQRLAQTGQAVRKVSRRDLPFIIANKGIGATTVSATMIAAHAAGIDVFVTGGIGGVHRGFEHAMDVSADLDELGRTPVAVVSAGVKSILDIPRTLQYLETKGIPVLTYKSKNFPAFFSASSGLPSPFTVESERQAAQIIYANQQLGLQNGLLLAVPNNNPAQGAEIQKAITQAIKESEQQKITGARITPFLLKRVNELTQGRSLKSNISLVQNNAEIGGKVARELARLKKEAMQRARNIIIDTDGKVFKSPQKIKRQSLECKAKGRIIAIGGSAVDYQLSPKEGEFELHKSNVGKTRKSLGGIARNIVDCSSKLGIQTMLITAVGRDTQSRLVTQFCHKQDIKLFSIQPPQSKDSKPTGRYYAILDHNNNQFLGISEMEINQLLTFDNIYEKFFKNQEQLPANSPDKINKNDIIVVDSNLPEGDMKKIVQYCAEKYGCMIVYEAKGLKSKKIITSGAYEYINVLKMNALEKNEIEKTLSANKAGNFDINKWICENVGSKSPTRGLSSIRAIVTNGPVGVDLVQQDKKSRTLKVPVPSKVEKTTGAGDTFTGTFCSMLLLGKTQEEALIYARTASKINIQSPVNSSVISDDLNLSKLEEVARQLKAFLFC